MQNGVKSVPMMQITPDNTNGADLFRNTYMNKKELAALLKISIRKLEMLIAEKKIPVTRLGRRCVRFRSFDVERVLMKYQVAAVEI